MIVIPVREKIANSEQYPQAILDTLDAFYTIASAAQWQTAKEVKQTFPEANVLKDGRIIFDIANKYHLGIKLNFQMQSVLVEFFEPYGKLMEILPNNSYLNKVDS